MVEVGLLNIQAILVLASAVGKWDIGPGQRSYIYRLALA
jgi:hypothetical protein